MLIWPKKDIYETLYQATKFKKTKTLAAFLEFVLAIGAWYFSPTSLKPVILFLAGVASILIHVLYRIFSTLIDILNAIIIAHKLDRLDCDNNPQE